MSDFSYLVNLSKPLHCTCAAGPGCKRQGHSIGESKAALRESKDSNGCREIGPKGAYCMDNDANHPMPHYNPLEMWRDA